MTDPICADEPDGRSPTVLIVDDEPAIRELFELWVGERYPVITAGDGETALEHADEADVALLDRTLPELSGTEVAERLDREDQCRSVAFVSAVEPESPVVELPCQEYLVKPVGREELLETVERLVALSTYADRLTECAALASKKAALESAHPAGTLATDSEYQRVRGRFDELLAELDRLVGRFDSTDYRMIFASGAFAPDGATG